MSQLCLIKQLRFSSIRKHCLKRSDSINQPTISGWVLVDGIKENGDLEFKMWDDMGNILDTDIYELSSSNC